MHGGVPAGAVSSTAGVTSGSTIPDGSTAVSRPGVAGALVWETAGGVGAGWSHAATAPTSTTTAARQANDRIPAG